MFDQHLSDAKKVKIERRSRWSKVCHKNAATTRRINRSWKGFHEEFKGQEKKGKYEKKRK